MRVHLFASYLLVPAFLTVARAAAAQTASPPANDWTAVEQALGRKGASNPGDVLKFSIPRSDMAVSVGGVQLKPALALGSWVAFKHANAGAMVMGDLVLAEEEVAPVMKQLQSGGVEQSALHNHLLMESPRVLYMHISAHGNAEKIATTIHDALALTKTPMDAPPPAAPSPSIDLDTAMIAKTLGFAGKANGGVYQETVPRTDRIMEHGTEIPPSMGVATAINFQPTGGGKAAITGDFVMTASEVNPVIRALTSHGIAVSALHSHMLEETPRLFFMHFWANDEASSLAAGLRAALDQMKVKRAAQP
ncbi:MAG: protein of unknown function LppY and LpqO [Gemmatimonadetes bacterium]|nr:protein of unknown function LppY and LpqO [Gemmatimonadota bacterium]